MLFIERNKERCIENIARFLPLKYVGYNIQFLCNRKWSRGSLKHDTQYPYPNFQRVFSPKQLFFRITFACFHRPRSELIPGTPLPRRRHAAIVKYFSSNGYIWGGMKYQIDKIFSWSLRLLIRNSFSNVLWMVRHNIFHFFNTFFLIFVVSTPNQTSSETFTWSKDKSMRLRYV